MDNEKLYPQEQVRDVRFEKPTFIDPLTGLFNRYYLYEFLPQEIKKSQFSDYSLGIFIIDIDNFKEINDKYGHLCGDNILKQFSDALKESRRQTDMVIRYAGDEFMILLPGVNRETGLSLGGRLVERMAKIPFKIKDAEEIRLTISVGLSLCPDDATEVDRLIDLADKALYLSKDKGKNQISYAGEVSLESAASQIAWDFFPCPKFIDRNDEIAKLKGVFDNVALGKADLAAAFIYADIGTGKTRLLSEFNNYAKDKALIIEARATLKHKEEPYYLFASALDKQFTKTGLRSLQAKKLFSALSEEELAELAKLLPQIEAVKPVSSGKQARSMLFKAVLNLLIAISNNYPVVVFSFDDLQWADNASIELLHYLIKYEKKRKIFAALGLKGKPAFEEKEKDALTQLLNYAHNSENALEISLADLSQHDTHEMIEAMFPGLKRIKELNDLIFDITKGNPAFIEEIFKSLVENKLLVYKDNTWSLARGLEMTDIPHSLGETIKKRLKNLDQETKELIVQAAVIGEDFSVNLLKKIGENNEGYIFEVMARAKKRHLVNESKRIGNFNFINAEVQDALYNELNEEERESIHEKIAQMLIADNPEDLQSIAADLSQHFGKVAGGAMASKYRNLLYEKAQELFNPAEVVDYLKEFTAGAFKNKEEEKEIKVELVALTRVEVSRLIKLIQSAVKNFQLYPAGSSLRNNFIKDIHHSLELILADTPRLEIIESGNSLVINGRRFSLREIQELGEGDFISLMIENNIKVLSFIQGVSEEEASVFLDNFSQAREARLNKSMWKEIIREKRLSHIKIDEFSYEEIASPAPGKVAPRRKLEDAMITEFLLGKISHDEIDKTSLFSKIAQEPQRFAAAFNKIAESAAKQGGAEEVESVAEGIKKISAQAPTEKIATLEAIENLSKVIMQLDWRLKNKFIRSRPTIAGFNKSDITEDIIDKISLQEIIGLIEHSIRQGCDNPLVLKDLIDKILPNKAKRQEALPQIEKKLAELGMDKEMAGALTGRLSWERLPIDKRLEALLTLPQEELKMLDLNSVSAFMEELLHKQNTPGLKKLIQAFMVKAYSSEREIRQKIYALIKDFLKKDVHIASRGRPLLEVLSTETNPGLYSEILDIIQGVSEEFVKTLEPQELYSVSQRASRKDYAVFISEAFTILEKRLKSQNPDDVAVHNSITSFIPQILKVPNFLEMLVAVILDYFQAEPKRIRGLLDILGDASQEILVDICLSGKKISRDSFEGYVMRKRVASVLKEMGEAALNRLKRYFSEEQNKENALLFLELAGHIGRNELVELIKPFLYNEDLELRRQAVLALGEIGSKETRDLLSGMLAIEKNKDMILLVKKILGKKIK